MEGTCYMTDGLSSRTGGEKPDRDLESRLRAAARAFDYPPTPDVARAVSARLERQAGQRIPSHRRLAWAAAVALLVAAGLLAVPEVRAALLRALRLGAVEILLEGPTPTATNPPLLPTASRAIIATATSVPTPPPLASALQLAGETTLEEIRPRVDFPIRLPDYPPDLGPPDRVFVQDLGGPVVVLVWLEPAQPDRVRLSLHELGPGTFAQKVQPIVVEETTVNGRPALWAEGPYLLQFRRDGRTVTDVQRLVEGHVLIWAEGEITYRLESDLPLEEAVRIAESLQPQMPVMATPAPLGSMKMYDAPQLLSPTNGGRQATPR